MNDFTTIPDYGLSWLEASGDHSDLVLSTRVRLARNLQGHAFGARSRVNDRQAVLANFKEIGRLEAKCPGRSAYHKHEHAGGGRKVDGRNISLARAAGAYPVALCDSLACIIRDVFP